MAARATHKHTNKKHTHIHTHQMCFWFNYLCAISSVEPPLTYKIAAKVFGDRIKRRWRVTHAVNYRRYDFIKSAIRVATRPTTSHNTYRAYRVASQRLLWIVQLESLLCGGYRWVHGVYQVWICVLEAAAADNRRDIKLKVLRNHIIWVKWWDQQSNFAAARTSELRWTFW